MIATSVLLAFLVGVVATPTASAATASPTRVAAPAAARTPVPEDASADAEKEARSKLTSGLRAADPAARAEALSAYSAATRNLGDEVAASKLVAITLARGLDDDAMAVRQAAVNGLAWGRHPDTAISALKDSLPELRKQAEKLSTRPDKQSQDDRRMVGRVYATACAALGRHEDDRSVDALAEELRKLRPNRGPGAVSELNARPLADALLALGSRDAVELVVKTTAVYSGGALNHNQARATAMQLHQALTAFSEEINYGAPPWSDRYDQAWRKWFKERKDELPAKLGKLTEPAPAPEYRRRNRNRDVLRPGKRERP